jgi:hypothetical protein
VRAAMSLQPLLCCPQAQRPDSAALHSPAAAGCGVLAGTPAFRRPAHCVRLHALVANDMAWGDEAVDIMCTRPVSLSLSLQRCGLGRRAADALGSVLRHNRQLKRLAFGANRSASSAPMCWPGSKWATTAEKDGGGSVRKVKHSCVRKHQAAVVV